MEQVSTNKSWAREMAVVLCIGLGVLAYAEKTEILNTFTWPVAVFTIGAFIPNKLQQLQSLGLGR